MPVESQELVEKYLPYAEALARSVRHHLPYHVELDELLSLARLGLVDAAQRFDPARGVSFKTYAYYRIRGTIFDGIRSMGPLSRGDVLKYKFQKSMELYLQQELEGRSGGGGAARPAGLGQIKELLVVMTSIYMLSLDSNAQPGEIASPDGRSPEEQLEQGEALGLLRRHLQRLSEQEQRVIQLYYYENRTLDEIGQELDLSKSWICRIHMRALKKLQKLFSGTARIERTALRV